MRAPRETSVLAQRLLTLRLAACQRRLELTLAMKRARSRAAIAEAALAIEGAAIEEAALLSAVRLYAGEQGHPLVDAVVTMTGIEVAALLSMAAAEAEVV